MQVIEICTKDPVTAQMNDSVMKAAYRMRAEHVGDLVVVDHKDGKEIPAGILTDRDIVVALLGAGQTDLDDVPVRDAMTKAVIVARADDDVDAVLSNMDSNGIRRVPVVDDEDRLVGLLAYDDVVAFMARRLGVLSRVVRRGVAREKQEKK